MGLWVEQWTEESLAIKGNNLHARTVKALSFSVVAHLLIIGLLATYETATPPQQKGRAKPLHVLLVLPPAQSPTNPAAELSKRADKPAQKKFAKERYSTGSDVALQTMPTSKIANTQPPTYTTRTTKNSTATVNAKPRANHTRSSTVFNPRMREKIDKANKLSQRMKTKPGSQSAYANIHNQLVYQRGNACTTFVEGHDETDPGYWTLPSKCGSTPTESDNIQKALHKALER